VLDELDAGDVLFFDGSHRLFQNSDVTVFFLEVLPKLRPGVLVHIHDIFLPDDYPASWTQRLYSEQYILAAMLLCERRPFKTVLPSHFVSMHDDLRSEALELFKLPDGGMLPGAYFNQCFGGSSFWIETIAS
jgi:methyltransferase family protein